MATEAQKRATKKYDDKAYKLLTYSCDVLTDDILQKAVLESSESKGEYVRNTLVRKLTKDGFLPPKAE